MSNTILRLARAETSLPGNREKRARKRSFFCLSNCKTPQRSPKDFADMGMAKPPADFCGRRFGFERPIRLRRKSVGVCHMRGLSAKGPAQLCRAFCCAERVRRAPAHISSKTPRGPPRPLWAWRCRWRPAGRPRSCGPSGCQSPRPWRRPPRRRPAPWRG